MTTLPPTGFTPALSERDILRNEIRACIYFYKVNKRNGWVDNERAASYWWSRAVNAIRKYQEYRARRIATALMPLDKQAYLALYAEELETKSGDDLTIEALRARLSDLEKSLDEAISPEGASAVYEEMFLTQCAIEKLNGAIDDYAEAKLSAEKYHTQL